MMRAWSSLDRPPGLDDAWGCWNACMQRSVRRASARRGVWVKPDRPLSSHMCPFTHEQAHVRLPHAPMGHDHAGWHAGRRACTQSGHMGVSHAHAWAVAHAVPCCTPTAHAHAQTTHTPVAPPQYDDSSSSRGLSDFDEDDWGPTVSRDLKRGQGLGGRARRQLLPPSSQPVGRG